MGFFEKLSRGLAKTKQALIKGMDSVLRNFVRIDEDLFDELEELLITSDMGVETTEEILDGLRERVKDERATSPDEVRAILYSILRDIMGDYAPETESGKLKVILVIGVNGVGKTTSIGKIASVYTGAGKKVLLAAADTFRAAAADQLKVWASRSGADIITHTEGSDPAAVVFDAAKAAEKRGTDVLIIDTAGRLHNKKNLMNELEKINRVIDRELPGAERETLLVLDATTGQNAVIQAKEFSKAADITGLVLTKLDGTAKGGIVIAIKHELDIPVRFVGVGEQIDDLQPFNAEEFVRALFD